MDMKTENEIYHNKMLRMARVRMVTSVLSTLLLLIIGYFALLMGGRIQTILDDAQSTFQTLNTLSKQLEEANITGLLDNVSTLVEDAQVTVNDAMGGVGQAVEKIEELDIEGLNKAITDLGTVVEPLASFFRR